MLKLFKKPIITFLTALLFFQPLVGVSANGSGSIKSVNLLKRKESKAEKRIAKSKSEKRSGSQKTENHLDRSNSSMKDSTKARKVEDVIDLEGQSVTRLPDGRWLLLGGIQNGKATNVAVFKTENSSLSAPFQSRMLFARAGHSATLLPDGKVLIFGGRDDRESLVAVTEIFDPQTLKFSEVKINGLFPRSEHTATLLTDGTVLIAGGTDNKHRLISKIELIDADKLTRQKAQAEINIARRNHSAHLQSDGRVLLWGGIDSDAVELQFGEIYDPKSQQFIIQPTKIEQTDETPQVSFSQPVHGETSVSQSIRPVLRFSELLNEKTITDQTVKLTGQDGAIKTKIIPAENGRLIFISAVSNLNSDSVYTISLNGVTDKKGRILPNVSLVFKTEELCNTPPAAKTPSTDNRIIDKDSWLPDADELKTGSSKDNPNQRKNEAKPLEAATKVTALSGQVLSLTDSPLAGVTVELQGLSARTDNEGRFLLTGLKPEQSRMVVRGETVNHSGKVFGTFEVLVDIEEGKTNQLQYKIFLPVIDKQNEVQLTTPTPKETIVTTPRVPGMEVHIPSNAVLKMPHGHGMSHNLSELTNRQEMKKLGITPIPINRPPFPLPPGVQDGLLFTLQMHGAKVQGPNGEKRRGLRFVFPNTMQQQPGERVQFWNYDSTAAGWVWYGYGTVSKDGKKVIPDEGVELEGMQCLSLMSSLIIPFMGPILDSLFNKDGDPVDLNTGLFVYNQTDLVLPDTIPINFTRTYRQNDGARDFGVGFTHPYNMFINGDTHNYGNLILPDGSRIKFLRDHSNTSEYVAYHTETPSAFYKAELRYLPPPPTEPTLGNAWEIKMRDGTRLLFARKTLYGTILGIHMSATALYQIIDRFGNKLTLLRDENLRLNRIVSPNNKWVEISYIGTSNTVSQIRDNIGRTVTYGYDEQQRLIKVTDPEGGETEYGYDAAHRMVTVEDARGVVNVMNEYDANGRVKKQRLADNTTYQFSYTLDPQDNSRVLQTDVTNPRGLVRRMLFNQKGYSTSEIYGVGRSDAWNITYERESISNRILRVTDHWNQKTAFNYDEYGNVLSTTYLEGTPDAVTTSTTYTAFDNVASATDPLNRTVNFTYDDRGLLTLSKDWRNRESSFSYNDKGQVLTATDALQRTSRFAYERGVLVEVEDPLGRKARRFVDLGGRTTRIQDPLGGTARYRYNKLNLPLQINDALGRSASKVYDAVGNPLEITDSRGGKIKYTYDAMHRPLTRTDQMNRVETYQYDSFGNLWKTTDHKQQVTEFSYDVFNRLTQVRYHDGTTTAYAYDEKDRVLSVTDSTSGTITYGYDVYDRVNSETTANGTVNYVFDTVGRLVSMKAPNQPLVTYGYDNADRVETITQNGQTVSFVYDDADRRTLMTLPNGITVHYSYDASSQLKSLTYKRGTTTIGDVSYEYDSNGRRTHVSGSLAQVLSPTPFASGVYDASNRQTGIGNQTLTYDQNGNLTSDGVNTYTWSARDELVSISGPNLTAGFAYDGEGRRISKTVNGITTTYVYDGLQVVEEHEQAGPVTTQLAGGLDEVFFRKLTNNGTSSAEYLLTDALGSTWGLADSTGNVQTEYKYDLFGDTQTSGQTSTTKNTLQFTGRENDGTGLYYYRNRYYSPALRRFISKDPLREAAGENEYAYVSNSPVNATDALGLAPDGPKNALRDPFDSSNWLGNAASNSVSDFVGGDDTAKDAWTMANRCLPLSDRLWAEANLRTRIATSMVGGGIVGKGVNKIINGVVKRIPCGPLTKWLGNLCFTAGTLIHTKAGLKPIEQITEGDEVLSFNEQTKQTEYKAVLETYIRETNTIIKLEIESETKAIETTPEHPFYKRVHRARDGLSSNDDEGEWQEARRLQTGDEVLTPQGEWRKILAVERQERSETVYNFAVADNHNYFVGQNGTLVHNQCAKWAPGIQNYSTGNMAAIEHVVSRHGPNTAYSNVSKFKPGTDRGDIRKLANDAVKNGIQVGNNSILHDAGRVIGMDVNGNPTNYVLIYLNNAQQIRTMFPF